jgi:hypothetical protein
MSPPLNIYFLGELKHLEAREKIVDDSGLMACLDKIVGWNICDNPILPEILFQFGQSPINTPDKLTKKSSAISSPSHLLSSGVDPTVAATTVDNERARRSPPAAQPGYYLIL